MSCRIRSTLVAWLTVVLYPAFARAGMPSPTLTEPSRLRFQTISFFVLGILLSAVVVALLWNSLRRDFPKMPRLSYGRAVMVVVLWGLLFIIVLTMIAGARELLTPGAWKKDGGLYKLDDDSVDKEVKEAERRNEKLAERRARRLEQLMHMIWDYAEDHDGQFPPKADDLDVDHLDTDPWEVPDRAGVHYRYVSGRTQEGTPKILVYEPDVYGDERHVLFTDGTIRMMSNENISYVFQREEEP